MKGIGVIHFPSKTERCFLSFSLMDANMQRFSWCKKEKKLWIKAVHYTIFYIHHWGGYFFQTLSLDMKNTGQELPGCSDSPTHGPRAPVLQLGVKQKVFRLFLLSRPVRSWQSWLYSKDADANNLVLEFGKVAIGRCTECVYHLQDILLIIRHIYM